MASDSPIAAFYAHIRPTLETLRSYANDPRPAYGLASLCMFLANQGAAALPFGFAHASLNAQATYRIPRLVPPFWQLVGFGALFGSGGYIISQGDTLNGSGVITGAPINSRSMVHDLSYVQDHTARPLALALSCIAGIKYGCYGNRSRGLWKLLL